MKLINLTPHKITIYKDGKVISSIEPTGEVVACKQVTKEVGEIDIVNQSIPLYETYHTEIKGLPDPVEGVLYIVPLIVASKLPKREDLVSPCNYVRDDEGAILGCQGFMKVVDHLE